MYIPKYTMESKNFKWYILVFWEQGTVCFIHCVHLHTAQSNQTRKRDLKSRIWLYFGIV